ncbi:MAG TPA: GH3 auxin-responsive promoter family protein [Flavobacteriaceae bacterium]|nr:GH3 auxin-responsive promoter family protein [Flavobacteriaceae bacterium]
MSVKSTLSKYYAKLAVWQMNKWASQPLETQQKVFEDLINQAKDTEFGKDHDFKSIKSHKDFVKRVPIRDYEALKPYIEKSVAGQENILWPGKPKYFVKTSGTTSGAKYIPLTKESLPEHLKATKDAILNYIEETGEKAFVDGKMMFLQGSPKLEEENGIPHGRLSGIVAHYVPNYLQKNRLPSMETNIIEDWETKVDKIIEETIDEDMTLISGIPSWVQMYFERLVQKTGKPVGEIFPNFKLFIYGGVNYEPYRSKFENLIGRKIDSIELYPASEGFLAFQDRQNAEDMLLLLDSGIFYEFIPVNTFGTENEKRLTIGEVEIGVNYVIILSTSAGLWGYNLGDTIQFTSLDPYRVVVTGRLSHFISAFGEHVIGKEVDRAMQKAQEELDFRLNEYTVAPQVNPPEGELPYHEWLIEFDKEPDDLKELARILDESMREQNSYYYDLITGRILQPLKITVLPKEAFVNYMRTRGKLGGQNKVPRLANDRTIADELTK